MRPITKLIVHCTDSPDDRDIGRREIDQWHRERGWHMIGYHFVVRKDGTIEVGREAFQIGAHCASNNLKSIGIVWVGRDDCNPKQRAALVKLLKSELARYRLEPADVVGHSEINPGKTCPNIDMDVLRAELSLSRAVRVS